MPTGRDALAVLERTCANGIDVPVGRMVYTAMLNRRGGFESASLDRLTAIGPLLSLHFRLAAANFATAFGRWTGVTPGEYRHQAR